MTMIDGNALMTLLTDKTANGTSDAFNWAGGDGTLFVSGTPGGATVALQWQEGKTGTPHPLDDSVALAAAGAVNFTLPPGWITAAITGASGTTSLTVEAKRIPS
jgi:hypothetical protein